MQLSAIPSVTNTYLQLTTIDHLFIRIVSTEALARLLNRQHLVFFPAQHTFQICCSSPAFDDDPWLIFKDIFVHLRPLVIMMINTTKQNRTHATKIFLVISIVQAILQYVRRNETICCLIGFGIGVGCCLLYRLISNYFTPSPLMATKRGGKFSKRDVLLSNKPEYDGYHRTHAIADDMTWSEMSSSLSTVNLFQDSYHSSSLTGDSGVDCPEMPIDNHPHSDDEQESFLRKYETHTANDSHIATEKGLERALEQTSRFYTDLEHIASDLGTLSKRYSQSHRSIDALDWDWQEDEVHSPKTNTTPHRRQTRSANKSKNRRKLNPIEYHESDHDHRTFDYSTSPLRRKPSSVYFDSTENTSDEENLGDETLQ